MSNGGKETLFSMGDDTPLAVLSESPRTLYDYFKQRFAQVGGTSTSTRRSVHHLHSPSLHTSPPTTQPRRLHD
jgi:hypothetical protein